MRQLLFSNRGVFVARMPRPAVEPGRLLVRVHFSLISAGTEVAAVRPPAQQLREALTTGSVTTRLAHAKSYLRLARNEPGKAIRRAAGMAKSLATDWLAKSHSQPAPPTEAAEPIEWTRCAAAQVETPKGGIRLTTDGSGGSYQAMSQPIAIPQDRIPVIVLQGEVGGGAVTVGLLSEERDRWLGFRTFEPGPVKDMLPVDPGESQAVTLVVASAGSVARAEFDKCEVGLQVRDELSANELGDQGANLGYSLAGEVVAVGSGIDDIATGDLVACAGAGQANHADYVSIGRNLACPIPSGCRLDLAATATVGAIALQGVRRAAPQLGDTVCVLGLGLIGQLTVQLLRANGCRVVGMDLDPSRVARAKALGMEDGANDGGAFAQLVRDCTGGHGADRTLITAATKSDQPLNQAIEVTRAKGTVVIVGDIGLNIQRAAWYRKELDVLMSTSYGPGRYDPVYEEQGLDYPFPYVRWTLNRNMRAYLELLSSGHLRVDGLIDQLVPVEEAPHAYEMLASGEAGRPLGVLISYPEDGRDLPEVIDSPRITLRGHRQAADGPLRYALVGAGAFGTAMLVPQMKRRSDRFFLRAVVSRNTTTGGNFARANEVEVLTTDLDAVLGDPNIDLIVIATRHHEHADQVVRSLRAGKHVFVEKPLALTWDELDQVAACYRDLARPPLLMVGFNRRFSPALQALDIALQQRRSPLVVHYRLNAGYLPPEHWVQGPQGGGRNVGEACHMYDVFRFLAGKPVSSVQAAAISPGALPYRRDDNFSASVTYQDGSLATLAYTALGPKQGLPKERLEVFGDGEAYVLDDYRSLVRCSDGAVLWQANEVDKGHREGLSRFGDAIATGGDAPIPFDELVETSAVALRVQDLILGRDGPHDAEDDE